MQAIERMVRVDGFLGAFFGVLAVALIVFALIVGLVVWAVRKAVLAFKGRDSFEAPAYRHLDAAAGSSAGDIASVLRAYVRADAVGSRAKTALSEVENVTRKRDSLIAVISSKFAEGSLSWDKFAVAVDAFHREVLCNCASLANRIQTFDVQDYRTLARQRAGSSYKRDNIPDTVQDERWNLLNGKLAEMDRIITANERLLLELDRLSIELGQLSQAAADDRTNQILGEIQSLIEEAKLYR